MAVTMLGVQGLLTLFRGVDESMGWEVLRWILAAAVVLGACGVFLTVVHRRYLYVLLGQKTERQPAEQFRTGGFAAEVFGQSKLLKDWKSGLMHIVIFYGFVIVQFGALDLIVKGLAGNGIPIFQAAWFTLTQEIVVALILLAILYSAYRRYVEKLARLKRDWKPSIVIFFISFIMLSVIACLAFERAEAGVLAAWSAPLSSGAAYLMQGISAGAASVGFEIAWWAHLLLLLAFLIYVPQSKHFHILVAPLNIWLRRKAPPGRLSTLNLEDESAETFGVDKIEQFTQKQLLDLYACVECGRCTNVCPAAGTGKLLSPMHLITKLRDHLTEKGAAITSKSAWIPAFAFGSGSGAHRMEEAEGDERMPAGWKSEQITSIEQTQQMQKKTWKMDAAAAVQQLELLGDVITEEEVWACTTCRNCEDQCPVDNEHVDKIIDLRRHLVLMRGSLPHDGQRAMQNIERQGNPWGISRSDRAKWTEELAQKSGNSQVPTVKEMPDFEILFFVGSMGSYDNRSRKVSEAFVRLMQEARVKFAILGNEEKNSGDTARRMGNEMLFQQLCAENIATLQKYGVRRIVTACPHTYNTLKHEYPEFGLEAEVIHHTELLAQLLDERKLIPEHRVNERITYHDSCYMGRYNDMYDPPRRILRSIPGVQLVEMERSRENAMCCGAGGGQMWMEETAGKRVNVARTEQALQVQPTVIGSACPYCLTMLEDGTKQKEVEDRVKARDVAEILAMSVFGTPNRSNF